MVVILFIVVSIIYWEVNLWEINANTGFPHVMFSIGVFLGVLLGVVLAKIQELSSNKI